MGVKDANLAESFRNRGQKTVLTRIKHLKRINNVVVFQSGLCFTFWCVLLELQWVLEYKCELAHYGQRKLLLAVSGVFPV